MHAYICGAEENLIECVVYINKFYVYKCCVLIRSVHVIYKINYKNYILYNWWSLVTVYIAHRWTYICWRRTRNRLLEGKLHSKLRRDLGRS